MTNDLNSLSLKVIELCIFYARINIQVSGQNIEPNVISTVFRRNLSLAPPRIFPVGRLILDGIARMLVSQS